MVDNQLWDEFHRVVNISSRELSEWLRTDSAGPAAEELPDRAGDPTGHHVLAILRKRKADLTADDERVMRTVVDQVHAQRHGPLRNSCTASVAVKRGDQPSSTRARVESIRGSRSTASNRQGDAGTRCNLQAAARTARTGPAGTRTVRAWSSSAMVEVSTTGSAATL